MRTFFVLVYTLFTINLLAQSNSINSISINLPQNPNSKTVNWGTGNSLITISAMAKMVNGRVDPLLENSKILVVIKKSGSVVCGIYTKNTAPAANFTNASKVWNGVNAVSLLGQECTLQPGDYELCVSFYGGPSNGLISEEKCKPFTILSETTAFNKPQNILPAENAIFNVAIATQPVNLKWMGVMPKPSGNVTYQVKIWKLNNGQTPAQAITQNLPIISKDVPNLTQTTVTNLIEPACLTSTTGCQYVWQVQALGTGTTTYGANNGKSDFTVFNVLKEATITNTSSCASTSTKTFVSGDEIKLSDDFVMKLTANPTGTNDSLTGVGTVRVKWLGIFNVRFKGIKIDGNNALCKGAVYTNKEAIQEYPVQFLVNATSVNNYGGEWTVNKLKELSNYIKANKNIKSLVPAFLTPQVDSSFAVQPINMPIGYFKDGDTANCIGFTEMIFRKEYAEFEAIANLNTQKFFKDPANAMNGTESIALRGVGIKFNNTGLTGVVGSLKLMEPVVVNYANSGTESLKLTFNKEASGHIGNGIVFDGLGTNFWKYNLDVDMSLPREWLIPANGSNTNVSLNFQLNISKWTDYVAEASLPACIIPNAKGLGVQAGVIAYDHSFIANPTNMVFPAGYAGNTNTFFTGFYLKNFKLTLPDELRSYADTSKKIEITAQNLIIDEYGLSGKIWAKNVLNFPYANIGNLGASIDTVSVNFANNSLTEAKMVGKIVLPLSSKNNVQDAINYTALFASNNSSFVFTLKPNNDIKSTFLGDGKLQINQTSTLNLTLNKINNKRAVSFNIDINGSLYYPSGKIIDPGSSLPLDLDLSCKFQHLGMTYATGNTDNFTFNPGQWSFASPQKKLSGFAFTITDIKPKIDPVETIAEKQYLFKGGVELTAKINIGSENSNIAISGDTKLILRGAIVSTKYTPPNTVDSSGMQILTAQVQAPVGLQWNTSTSTAASMVKEQYGFLTELKPKYLGVEVKSVKVDVSTPAVKIKGSVEFFKKDIKYGNGFKGTLEAKFTTPSLSIQAGAIFGNTKYIPNNAAAPFKYWMVEAQVGLPPPGIAFLGALAIRGFGAGVYSRMNMTPPTTFNPTQAASSTFGGAVFTPDATVKFGFKAKVLIATTPKEETFNGSAALSAEFNNSGGMNFIRFEGQFYCGAKMSEPTKAFGSGQLLIDYNFPTKELSMNVSISINKDPITTPTPANIRLYINGKTNKWYFKAGVPTNPMAVKLNSTDINAYLMFGNDLGTDIPTGFMQKTKNGFANLGFAVPTFSESATSDNKIKSGKGFALGIGVYYSKNDSKRVEEFYGKICKCTRFLDINYNISAGAEINASFLQYANCEGLGDGWRAKVGLAVYAGASVSYSYSLPALGSGSGNLVSIKGAASAIAEFPKPTYLSGYITGSYSISGYSGSLYKDFSIGNQCSGSEQTTNETSAVTQQNAIDELNYSLIKNIVTPGTDNVDRKTDIVVDLNYPFNKSFDVDEQQATGEIKVRTFRANYTVTLTQDSSSGGSQMATFNASSMISSNSNQSKSNSSTSSASNTTTNNITLYPKGVDMYGAQKFALNSMSFGNNALLPNTSYKFKIVGKLEENINGSWQVVKKKNSNTPITETQQLYFKTNANALAPVVSTNSGSNKNAKKL